MYLEVVFKTGKSHHRSEGLQETVPNHQKDNRKGSVSDLGSCPWNMQSRLVAERIRCRAGSLLVDATDSFKYTGKSILSVLLLLSVSWHVAYLY